jgi:hypothetical protein
MEQPSFWHRVMQWFRTSQEQHQRQRTLEQTRPDGVMRQSNDPDTTLWERHRLDQEALNQQRERQRQHDQDQQQRQPRDAGRGY